MLEYFLKLTQSLGVMPGLTGEAGAHELDTEAHVVIFRRNFSNPSNDVFNIRHTQDLRSTSPRRA